VTVEFESVRFMQVSGATVVARPIRRPGRSNVAGVIDRDSDDCVGVDPWSRKREWWMAVASQRRAAGGRSAAVSRCPPRESTFDRTADALGA
jgi:hypothetical protein